jgi:glycosyltransferase involved in cell wall biosynthesis
MKNIKVLLMAAVFLLLGNGDMFSADPVKDQVLEKPMVIIIPSYNNKKWYQANLKSALAQDYSNYRIIYVDDCSNDGMSELVQEFIQQNDVKNRIKYTRNEIRHGALYNIYCMVTSCRDDEIIVTLDGDDFLYNNQVLKRLNKVYQDENVWLTYGSLVLSPKVRESWWHAYDKKTIEQSAYRDVEWEATHLRTFYAWLFKNINYEDFLFEGKFFSTTGDLAQMFPMLEMADGRIAFIDDVLYVYNVANNLNDFRVCSELQKKYESFIRAKKRYARLEHAGIRGVEASVYRL